MLTQFLATTIAFAGLTAPQSDPLARAPGTDVRVIVWNVYGFPDRNPERQRRATFAKIFRAIDADLVILNEVSGATGDVIAALPAGQGLWSWVRDGELFVAARGAAHIEPAFERPRLPPSGNFFARLIEWIFGPRRATAIGAVVHHRDRSILVVPVHLPCCANESGRLRDAHAIRRALDVTPLRHVDATIVAGDFNTVRGRRPVDIVRGTPSAAAPFTVLDPLHLDGRSDVTWRDDRSPFPPGRLDWLLNGGALVALHSFVFDTSPSGAHVSDHLPIVADFRWR